MIAIVVIAVAWVLLGRIGSIEHLAGRESDLTAFGDRQLVLAVVLDFVIDLIVNGALLPGATVLTLVSAWYFGFPQGAVLVRFASTTGATLAFLGSRYLARD